MSPESTLELATEPLSHVEDYYPWVRGGIDEFIRHVTHPVLLVTPLGRTDERVNATVTLDLEGDTDVTAKETVGPLAEPLVIPVKRRSDNATPSLWIGRASHCDIILPFEGISRVHAVIRLPHNGPLCIGDVSSRNGTLLNGEALEPGKMVELDDDSLLMFADIEVTYLLPETFYGELRRKLR
jgi:hypothetical protein